MYPRRFLCNLKPTVLADSIFMQEMTPSKLAVPTASKQFEFTLRDDLTVGQFEAAVLANTENEVTNFKVTAEGSDEATKIGSLKQN